MRNLIVCCDGTWNTPDQEHDGVPVPTNVVRFYNAVPEGQVTFTDRTVGAQLKYYHSGVGAEGNWWEKLVGGGVGIGLGKNVLSAYRWLGANYQADDRIFLLGFSRGAFTARSLGGMISTCGLLNLQGLSDKDVWSRVSTAYDKGYRKKEKFPSQADWAGDWAFNGTGTADKKVRVRFVGVWDTVGALGIPNDLAILNLVDQPNKYSFHDTSLSPLVDSARHAVAMDEKRASFTPTLWTGIPAGRDVKQVWFPGVHSDVGGGYPEIGLSNGALLWMMQEAEGQGLVLNEVMRGQIKADPRDVLHDSCTGLFSMLPTQPRSVPMVDPASAASLHPSVLDRQTNPPISQAPYRVSTRLAVGQSVERAIFAINPWNETGIYLEAGAVYELSATGEWMDGSIVCGPDGAKDGKFQPGEIAHLAGTLLGKVEKLYQYVTGNKSADFKGTRRSEDYPWFMLVGAVANGGEPTIDGTPEPHQLFRIGTGCQMDSLTKSGYLYCFANDAWNFYGNNRGSVRLTVRRLS